MSKFNKEMTMGEILEINPDARAVLEGFGMHCCGCPVSQAEALEDACKVHDVDVELVLEELEELDELNEAECGCGCMGHCDCTEEDNCGCDCWEDECDCDDECEDECDCGCNEEK